MRFLTAIVVILALGACATSPDLPTGGLGEEETTFGTKAPKRLLACYVVLAFGEMVYTDAFYFEPLRAAEARGNLELAADRVRDWPDVEHWQDTEARYATITIALALEESLKEKALGYLAGGISIANFRRLAGKAAVKGAVLEALIDDMKRQLADQTATDDDRITACLDRLTVVETRLKALNGLT